MSHQPIQLFIKTLKGKTITLNGYPHSTISQIKDTIQHMELLPSNQMRLKYAGKDLADNGTLLSYEIKNLSTLDMTMRMRGGFKFIDVSIALFKDCDVSTVGPKRLTIHDGINIEGICDYSKCEEKGRRVICQIEGKTFDFSEDKEKVLCPICESMFQAKNCGFYQCIFSFEGSKLNPETSGTEQVKLTEKTTYKKYKTIDELTKDNGDWTSLTISADIREKDENDIPL